MADSAIITTNVTTGTTVGNSGISTASITSSVTPATTVTAAVVSGAKGDKGDTGSQGPQGIQGIQGIQGDTGPQGPAGSDATVPDADATTKGKLKLAGDLGGTADLPTVPGLTTHTARTDNPHSVTKTQVGLGNVDNTSDAAKPISTATQTALDSKAATVHTHAQSDVTNLTTDLAAKKTDSMATNKLLGRGTGGTGVIEEITLGTNLSLTGTTLNAAGGSGSGDLVGPASATDNAIVRFDGTTGKLVQNSGVTVSDAGEIVSSVTPTGTASALDITSTTGRAAKFTGDIRILGEGDSPYSPDGGGVVIEPFDGTTTGATAPYGRLMFNPEKRSLSAATPADVVLSAHKYHRDNTLHEHFTIYTSNAAGTPVHRLDIDYLQDIANFDVQNSQLIVGGTLSSASANLRGIKSSPNFTGAGGGAAAIEASPDHAPSVSTSAAYGFINIAKGSPSTGVTITNLYGGFNRIDTGSTAGAVTSSYANISATPAFGTLKPTTSYGMRIQNQGSTGISTTYGMYIDAQSASTANYALYMAGSGGTAAEGIHFTADTNLYRSAGNTLKTDDSFIVTGSLTASSLALTTDLPITEGGTGASTASAALTNLGAEATANKGAANGYAPLNASTKIDSTYLPSYVDDVEEYANLAGFPVTGETGKIYIALDTNKTYRWSGSAYVQITSGAVDSVNGRTGVVTGLAEQSSLDTHEADTTSVHGITDTTALATGPASATDEAIVRFDGTTGKLVQNSGFTISDTNTMSVTQSSSGSEYNALSLTNSGGAANSNVSIILRAGNLATARAKIVAIAPGGSDTDLSFQVSDNNGAPTERLLIDGDGAVITTGNSLASGYLRAGSTTAPANTTAGDITGTRLSLGNGAHGASGHIIRVDATTTPTAAGANYFAGFNNTFTPASTSSSEVRALAFENITNPATGINVSTIRGGYFLNRFRLEGTTGTANAVFAQAVGIDSSSPAVTGVVSNAQTFVGNLASRFSGTGTVSITTGIVYDIPASSIGTGITVGTMTGFRMQNPNAPDSLTTLIGMDLAALTRGATNIGMRIAAPSGGATANYALQLSDTGGTAAGGITFGTDTTLYRSAADTLKTDDGLVVGRAVTSGVVALTDGANIATNAALGNTFTVTLAGNRTMDNPTNPIDGQKIIYKIKQDATGSRTITWGAAFRFGTDVPSPTLTTTASKTDYIGFIYNLADTKWDCIAVAKGY